LGVGLTIIPCKKENCSEASKKFSRILRRRPRPKLCCGAKERQQVLYSIMYKFITFPVLNQVPLHEDVSLA
jgi:hypothetical protein